MANSINLSVQAVSDEPDDLSRIKGIGQASMQSLNRIGIYRFAELAALTPESLAASLKEVNPGIVLQRIEKDDWIGQARALASEKNNSGVPASPQQAGKRSWDSADWHELADFFISYGYAISQSGEKQLQTKVHHSQAGQSERWDGIATEPLLNWMLEKADLPESGKVPTDISSISPASGEPVVTQDEVLKLTDLRVIETNQPTVINGKLHRQVLRTVCLLRLNESARKFTYEQVPFTVELHLINLQTQHSRLATSQSFQLNPGYLTYEITQDFPLPVIGHHQLYVSARLLPPGVALTHLKGPVIHVEN